MIYLLQTEEGIQYPYAKGQLRLAFPNTSFPSPITDECAAEHGCFPVATIEQPEHDPRTQRLEEDMPEQLEDGTWQQVLRVRDASPEEIEAWDISNRPAPDWTSFMGALLSSPEMNAAMIAARDVEPIAAGAFPAAVINVSEGRGLEVFASCWSTLKAAELIPEAVSEQIIELADICYLPEEVISILSA